MISPDAAFTWFDRVFYMSFAVILLVISAAAATFICIGLWRIVRGWY